MLLEATKDACRPLEKHETSALHTGTGVVEVVAIEVVVLELEVLRSEDVVLGPWLPEVFVVVPSLVDVPLVGSVTVVSDVGLDVSLFDVAGVVAVL